MSSTFSEISWDAILQSIVEEKCILCIGPGLYAENGQTLEAKLAQHLRSHGERLRIRVYDDAWFHYLPGGNAILPHLELKNFYKQPFPRAKRLVEKIAKISFHFIISALPDYLLKETFESLQLPHRFDAYHKKKPSDPGIFRPTAQVPLLYNFMGELNQRDSMVLTYDDFYDYLESVFEGNSLAPLLRDEIAKADNFIFLGLPFDRWYMHLMLRILGQHRNKDLLKYAPIELLDKGIQTHCAEQFNITFVPMDYEQFLETLLLQCASIPGLIREASQGPEGGQLNQYREMVAADDLENAFEQFLVFLSGQRDAMRDVLDETLMLNGSLENLSKQQRLGLMDFQEYSKERARIRYGLLEIINKAEKRR